MILKLYIAYKSKVRAMAMSKIHSLTKKKSKFLSGKHQDSESKVAAAAAAKSLQSCPTLCNHRDISPPGPPVPGILQARTLK